MYTVAAHIMNKRVDSMNMITIDVPVAMQAYIREIDKADEHPITHYHGTSIVAAYLRTVASSRLNRFIVNKNLYARNEFCVGLVLKEGKDADGTMSKIYFDMTDDVLPFREKIDEYISGKQSGLQKAAPER